MIRLTRREFRRLALGALEGLPPQARGFLDNVDIVVQDWPTPSQLATAGSRDRYDLFGLYEGVPRTERQNYTMVLPDRISLFQRPIEAACHSREELAQEVRATIVHEIAHHLGWSDEELERMGLS